MKFLFEKLNYFQKIHFLGSISCYGLNKNDCQVNFKDKVYFSDLVNSIFRVLYKFTIFRPKTKILGNLKNNIFRNGQFHKVNLFKAGFYPIKLKKRN
jgi:hypothetical protein